MKKRLFMLFLVMIAAVSFSVAAFAFAVAETKEPVYSDNLAINGDFETAEQIGMTKAFSDAYGTTNYWGNFYSTFNLGAGIFHTNNRAYPDNVKAELVAEQGVDSSNAVKVTYNGINDGFAYRLYNAQANSTLIKPGKTYEVSVQVKTDVDKKPCGPKLSLGIFGNEGNNAWIQKEYFFMSYSWDHKANVWDTLTGTFSYDVVQEDNSTMVTVNYRDANDGQQKSTTVAYEEFVYINLIFSCDVGQGVTNEVYYDNFTIKEVYEAKVQVTDQNADPIADLESKFTVNGKAVTPTYDNDMYVFTGLTGESEIELTDTTLGLTNRTAKVYGDRSAYQVLEGNAHGWWTTLKENDQPRSILFGTPRLQDIAVTVVNGEGVSVEGAVLTAGDYTIEADEHGAFTIKDVWQTAPVFEVSVKAPGCFPATFKIDGSQTEREFALKEIVDKSENLIVNGDLETNENFLAYKENFTDAEVERKFRAIGDKSALALGDDPFGGVHSLDLNLTAAGGGDCGVAYRIPAEDVEHGKFYSFGARVKAAVPSVGNDAVYIGFAPVLKLKNGSTKTWVPAEDFNAYFNDCSIADSYPLKGWQNLTAIISTELNDSGVFTAHLNKKLLKVSNVEEVIGYDVYFVFSNGDAAASSTMNIDRVTLGIAVGYTGIDLGNDATNGFPNGDFESASTIKGNYVTPGYWTTSSDKGRVEQSTEYAKNGMASLKATFEDQTFLTVRTVVQAGKHITDLNEDALSALPANTWHSVKGYVKSESVGATLSFNFMPTFFYGGTYTDAGATGGHVANPIATHTFTEDETLDGEWIEMTASFYYTVDFATGTFKAWFNGKAITEEPDFMKENIYELHAIDLTFSTDRGATVYFDLWTAYAPYDATITVLGDNGSPVIDKELVFKDYFGNDITESLTVTVNNENKTYELKNVTLGPVTVSVKGDDVYAPQTVDYNHRERSVQKPYSYTITVKTPAGTVLGKDALQVSVKQEGNDVGTITWNANGSFTISDLTGADIDVTIVAQGYKNGYVTVSQEGSFELKLEEDVKPAFNAIVTVKDAENKPINNAKVEIKRGDTVLATATKGRNGTYTLSGLNDDEAGDLKVVVTLEGYTFETDKVVTRAASTVQVIGTAADEPATSGGCGGSVVASAALAGALLAAFCAVVLAKKREKK